jgi:spore maturation protein SpmB
MNQRAALGSHDPAGIIGTTLFATMCSTVFAVSACKIAERFSPTPVPEPGEAAAPAAAESSVEPVPVTPPIAEPDDSYPLWASVVAIGSLIPFAICAIVFGETFGQWIVPLMVFGFATWAWAKDVPIYEAFIEGAREGFEIGVRIIPYLVAILGVVGMLRGAGTIALFGYLVGPLTEPLGMPAEAVPMVLLRPLSGSGANGLMMSILNEHGPDSYVGYLVSTIQGSTETTFYVLAVYFGSVGIKRIRHAMIPGLVADLMGAIGAIIAVQAYFWYNAIPL